MRRTRQTAPAFRGSVRDIKPDLEARTDAQSEQSVGLVLQDELEHLADGPGVAAL